MHHAKAHMNATHTASPTPAVRPPRDGREPISHAAPPRQSSTSVWIARKTTSVAYREQRPQLARDIDTALHNALQLRDALTVAITPVTAGDGSTDGVILTIVYAAR